MNKPDDFFREFKIFLTHACHDIYQQKKLTRNWMLAVSERLGTSATINIFYDFNPPFVETGQFTLEEIISSPGKAFTNLEKEHPLALRILIESIFEPLRVKLSVKDEKQRIKQAEIIFNRLVASRKQINNFKYQIMKLHRDLVEGKQILI